MRCHDLLILDNQAPIATISNEMIMIILFGLSSAFLCFVSISKITQLQKKSYRWEKSISLIEKFSFILLTAGLVIYVQQLGHAENSIAMQSHYFKKPLGWLLYTWCINAASILMEIIYGNTSTALFANIWTTSALTLLPSSHSRMVKIPEVFSNDLDWLSLHRLCFLMAYAFCILALPLALHLLWKSLRRKYAAKEGRAIIDKKLWKIDRMQYRLILWALPLLTLGILVEALHLLDNKALPSPMEIWNEQKESFLALATWFICGVYLHSRLFLGWRHKHSALFYLVGLILILAGHLSNNFFHFSVSIR